jgi:ADP-ribosylglycohydrolase
VNHLGDADSTAAVCGQIAGAFYGHACVAAEQPGLVARLQVG